MSNKKILIFAPYGRWQVHHQVDAVLGASLKQRGCDVIVLCCDCFFVNCPIATQQTICEKCSEFGLKLFNRFNLPTMKISEIIPKDNIAKCNNWINSVSDSDLPFAVFDNFELGKWVSPGIFSYFGISKIDYTNKNIMHMYRSLVLNAAYISMAYKQILKHFYPDHILCYSGIHAFYRVFFMLAQKNNIPVLCHERGFINDSFSLLASEHDAMYTGRKEAWNHWSQIPLSKENFLKIKQYFIDREIGVNTNFEAFYQFSSLDINVRQQLRIPVDSKIVLFAAASCREIEMEKWDVKRTYEHQILCIKNLIDIFRSRKEYLVIRCHPHKVGLSNADTQFLKDLFSLCRNISSNIRIVMPNEKLTSYSIIWNADAIITYGSTLCIEAIARGIACASAYNNIYSVLDIGVENIKSPDECGSIIDKILLKTQQFSIENLRTVYRATHFLFFRLNFIFKSFGIKDGFGPDIRINNISDLMEGKDRTLDHVCSHILKGTPLLPIPDEAEKQMSDNEETGLLLKEIENITKKRTQLKQSLINIGPVKEPLISVVRIRQNAVHEMRTPTKPPTRSLLYQTMNTSRHKNIERLGMTFLLSNEVVNFTESISEILTISKGEYLYFGTDRIHIDESFFSSAIDFLEDPKNISYDCCLTGGWIFNIVQEIQNEIFTEAKPNDTYDSSICHLPYINNPAQFLSFFIFRKTCIENLISIFKTKQIMSVSSISSCIYEIIFSDNSPFNVYRTLIPQVAIYEEMKASDLMDIGISLLEQKQFSDALYYLDNAKVLNPDLQNLNYIRAIAKFYIGDYWGAQLAIDNQLIASSDQTIKELPGLNNSIQTKLGNNLICFEDISDHIETIDRQLVPGQEKFLFEKVKKLSENSIILEVGARFGGSTASLAYACIGTNKKIFTIDSFGCTVGYRANFFDIWQSTLFRLDLEKFVTPLPGLSHDQLAKWGNKPLVDFVFIDASHDYPDVIKDFELVYPIVKDGGFIAFHDVTPNWPGAWRVWVETANPLLSSHEFCATIACGRKHNDRMFTISQFPEINFSYAKELTQYFINIEPKLSHAMKLSMDNTEQDIFQIEAAEKYIAFMPQKYKTIIHDMLRQEASDDPYLNYWNALICINEGKKKESIQFFDKAITFSDIFLQKRIHSYLTSLISKKVF